MSSVIRNSTKTKKMYIAPRQEQNVIDYFYI